jgi:hypothetical protein
MTSPSPSTNVAEIRAAVIEALPVDTSLHGRVPEVRNVYVPASHVKALRLECDLVIGGRGVGKSFWSAALSNQQIRSLLGRSVRDFPEILVSSGFGERPESASYPDPDVFGSLLKLGHQPYHVWRAVVCRWTESLLGILHDGEKWDQTVARTRSDPESLSRSLDAANRHLADRGEHGLLIFDALDRSSTDWKVMDDIVRDLLRLVLSLKPYRNLHTKVFLREDQFYNRRVTDFPDASKLQSNLVELTWFPHDLHGLLWNYLINAAESHGDILREICKKGSGATPRYTFNGIWQLPDTERRETEEQKVLFELLAGKYMGNNSRRGYTYSWSVGHLADARGRTSPRSFLAGIRAAAEDSTERYAGYEFPLHYESIKRGVQTASKIRVNEIGEDYPWIDTFLDPLRGLNVPCDPNLIDERWSERFGPQPAVPNSRGLPPEHTSDGWPGIRADLGSLGIFDTMKDGRVNMPDLYRVGFGLGRRGGVKPMAKG